MLTSLKICLFLFISCSLVSTAVGVDRSKFKNCAQSSFCQRNREHKPFQQKWTLNMSTLVQEGQNVVGELVDEDTLVRLELKLSLTDKGAIRMKMDQIAATRGRFEARDALNPGLRFRDLQVHEKAPDKCTFKFGGAKSYKLVLSSSPFKAEVLDSTDRVIVAMNSKGLMRFEDHKALSEGNIQPAYVAPSEAKAFDEAGRPLEEAAVQEEQPRAEKLQAESTGTYAETFSTFTDSRPYGPMSVGMDIYFPHSEYVYGIPEHADSFALKDTRPNIGDPYRLYNVDIFEYELYTPMSLYGSIPFIMAQSKSVGSIGVLWLNPSETWIDLESNHSQSRGAGVVDMISSFVSSDKGMSGRLTHWFSETGLIDIWLMPGPEPSDVLYSNAEILGTIPMPPVSSTGFHQCRWNYYSSNEVMQVERNYDQVEIPVDAIWLDVEYTSGRSKKYFTYDSIAFPNLAQLAQNLSSRGRRLITIIDPHIKKEDGYDIYEEGNSLDVWVKDPSGERPYEGWCWPGASLWPDYLLQSVREWWGSKFDPAYFPGDKNAIVDIWNDMNEPSVFNGPEVTAQRDLRYAGGWENRDIHNIYGFYLTQATYEGMCKHRGHLDRPFVLTRSLFAGSQRYCAAWTGDNQANWGHLKMTIPMLLSLSIAGMPFVGADVGGFFNNPESDELVVRWHQAGAFQPFFRAHAHHDARHREAYLFQGQTLNLLRNAINLRYSYSPYWYTLFNEAHRKGLPMLRPLWFHESADEKAYQIDDSHLLGYSLLVKPITEKGLTAVDVYLPGAAGQTAWFDLNSYQMYQGGMTVTVPVDLSTIPLFQRAGTIVPRYYRTRRSLELLMKDPITIDIVLGESQGKTYAHGSLYVDQYKKLDLDDSSSTLKDILYYDEYLSVKPSTEANLSHGVIERILIYNWPQEKRINSILVAPDTDEYSHTQGLSFKLNTPRGDGTSMLEIRRPQLSSEWKKWMLKIELVK